MIEAWQVLHIHDTSPRYVSRCDDCGKRRLTTQLTLGLGKRRRVDFLCNECLCKTPPWPERKAR